MQISRKSIISIILIWLFNFTEITGVLFGYKEKVMTFAPVKLLVYLGIILWNSERNKKLFLGLLIPFGFGMFIEYVGVNYDSVFGTYEYGENLGIKLFGVPLLIGFNWAMITYCTSAIAEKISPKIIVTSILGALLFVALDIVVEFSAPRFDFWELKSGIPFLREYFWWLIASFITHLLFLKIYNKSFKYPIAVHVFIALFVFSTVFIFF
ncbi:hypothetical protein AB832_02130 [Flavobacteriaceae bacterium (ex Bugula neritina AB1)]|nr:hypothetical protein AB832_02130 [Flavobacteriaceae bacterium (ex Bugula neritina AB1)]